MTRRLFLARAGSAVGVVAFLPLNAFARRIPATTGERYFEHTILAMGTTARVGVYAGTEKTAARTINLAFAELKRMEAQFTVFDPASDISRINVAAGERSIVVAPEVIEIVQRSIEFSAISSGAFDITVGPLMELWGFRADTNELSKLPTDAEVQSALHLIGSHMIEVDSTSNRVALRKKGAKLDLGGIAVGFALDRMTAILRSEGIQDAFIDISGDIVALGKPHSNPAGWPIGIPDPQLRSKLVYQTTISDKALATSGNYMSYVVYQANRFGHIMDPKIGRSAERVLSTTAIANDGISVDALSTASFAQGFPIGRTTQFVIVDPSGSVATTGMAG